MRAASALIFASPNLTLEKTEVGSVLAPAPASRPGQRHVVPGQRERQQKARHERGATMGIVWAKKTRTGRAPKSGAASSGDLSRSAWSRKPCTPSCGRAQMALKPRSVLEMKRNGTQKHRLAGERRPLTIASVRGRYEHLRDPARWSATAVAYSARASLGARSRGGVQQLDESLALCRAHVLQRPAFSFDQPV